MGLPAARLTDMHACPMVNGLVPHVGGPIIGPCWPTVLIVALPAARVSDQAVCVGPPDIIVRGSATVLIGGMPSARIGDPTAHGGAIVTGAPMVLVGDAGAGGGGPAQVAGRGMGQAAALRAASHHGAAFCERCEAAKRALEADEAEDGEQGDGEQEDADAFA